MNSAYYWKGSNKLKTLLLCDRMAAEIVSVTLSEGTFTCTGIITKNPEHAFPKLMDPSSKLQSLCLASCFKTVLAKYISKTFWFIPHMIAINFCPNTFLLSYFSFTNEPHKYFFFLFRNNIKKNLIFSTVPLPLHPANDKKFNCQGETIQVSGINALNLTF